MHSYLVKFEWTEGVLNKDVTGSLAGYIALTEGLVDLDLLAAAADDGEVGAPPRQRRQARRRHQRRRDHGRCHLDLSLCSSGAHFTWTRTLNNGARGVLQPLANILRPPSDEITPMWPDTAPRGGARVARCRYVILSGSLGRPCTRLVEFSHPAN